MVSNRGVRWFAALVVVATVAACGGDDDDDSSDDADATSAATGATTDAGAAEATTAPAATTPDAGSTATATEAPDATEPTAAESTAPAEDDPELDPDGRLTIGTFAIYPWDPAKQSSGYAITQLALVFDRLVHTAPDGSLVPGLATAWEYSPDGTTLTFDLRDDVTFQDGTPFDAAAVKANIERSQTLEGSSSKADLARIAEVVAVDPQTVELHLASPDATLPAVFSGAAGAMMSPASMADPTVDAHPVGTGMYTLGDYVPASSYSVERWDGYWDPDAVKLAGIDVVSLPDSAARINALRTGEIDIAPVEPSDVETIEQTDGMSVDRNETLRYVYLAMNLAETPLDNLQVRQAISHAIDRQALVDGPFFGLGTPTAQPWPDGYFPHVAGLDDDATRTTRSWPASSSPRPATRTASRRTSSWSPPRPCTRSSARRSRPSWPRSGSR